MHAYIQACFRQFDLTFWITMIWLHTQGYAPLLVYTSTHLRPLPLTVAIRSIETVVVLSALAGIRIPSTLLRDFMLLP